ncbi:hypothetical protein JAV55_21405 (plasmid) [Bacillus licheniformis]|nr:hypothetical protein JAV55_21405 [Bacillus licheniformis]
MPLVRTKFGKVLEVAEKFALSSIVELFAELASLVTVVGGVTHATAHRAWSVLWASVVAVEVTSTALVLIEPTVTTSAILIEAILAIRHVSTRLTVV